MRRRQISQPPQALCIACWPSRPPARLRRLPWSTKAGSSRTRNSTASANRLAHRLRKRNVGLETRVGVCLPSSPEFVIALYAALKAGGVYLPLDPNYPPDRLAFMLSDAAAPLVITVEPLRKRLAAYTGGALPRRRGTGDRGRIEHLFPRRPGFQRLCLSHLHIRLHRLAKGSRGAAPGSRQPHAVAASEVSSHCCRRHASETALSFDASITELTWPLLAGARMVLARPGASEDPDYMARMLIDERITVLQLVPSLLRVLIEQPAIPACTQLRRVICAAEALPWDLQERFFRRLPHAELHNLYGPTEAAIDVTAWQCVPGQSSAVVPIGRPIANIQIYVLDRHMEPQPIGVPGELHIGGSGLARGYRNLPDLTAARFLPDPFSHVPGARLYATGDLVRYRPDGQLEFIGRLDQQVKIRGFRSSWAKSKPRCWRIPTWARQWWSPGLRPKRPTAALWPMWLRSARPVPRGRAAPRSSDPPSGLHAPSRLRGQAVRRSRSPPTASWTAPNRRRPRRASDGESPNLAPGTPVEGTLAAIWATVLGLERSVCTTTSSSWRRLHPQPADCRPRQSGRPPSQSAASLRIPDHLRTGRGRRVLHCCPGDCARSGGSGSPHAHSTVVVRIRPRRSPSLQSGAAAGSAGRSRYPAAGPAPGGGASRCLPPSLLPASLRLAPGVCAGFTARADRHRLSGGCRRWPTGRRHRRGGRIAAGEPRPEPRSSAARRLFRSGARNAPPACCW